MDEESGPARRSGGTVEPIKHATTPSGRPRLTTQDPPGREYELYDPFANVKHRAKTFDEMAAKADRAQAIRFTALEPDGTRIQIYKVDGQWQLPPPAKPLPFPDRETMIDLSRNAPARPESTERLSPAAPANARSQPNPGGARQDLAIAQWDAAADRAAEIARIQAALHERYIVKRALLSVAGVQIGQTEYRFRGDNGRVAFTESNTRLATDTNSPSVARSMVDVAQARQWKGLRVSGNADFRRMVWLEATVRGVRTVGYEPLPGDLELLRKERDVRQLNRVEPLPEQSAQAAQPAAARPSGRGGGGRKAVLAALEAVLLDRKVPERQREAVMAAAAESLARRTAAGEMHRVKVYDKAAPSRRPVPAPTPEMQRNRERAEPTPVR
jgi:hypothetical protein